MNKSRVRRVMSRLLPGNRKRRTWRAPRRVQAEPLENRQLLAAGIMRLQNFHFPEDVNDDGTVTVSSQGRHEEGTESVLLLKGCGIG